MIFEVITIFVAVVLIAFAVAYYLKSKPKEEKPTIKTETVDITKLMEYVNDSANLLMVNKLTVPELIVLIFEETGNQVLAVMVSAGAQFIANEKQGKTNISVSSAIH